MDDVALNRWLLTSLHRRRWAVPICLSLIALVVGFALAEAPVVGYVAAGLALLILFVLLLVHNPFWGLGVYMVTFYVRPGELFPVLAPLHLERGLLALAMLLWHRRPLAKWATLTHRVTFLMAGFLGIMAISVVSAFWKTLAVLETIEFAKILAAYLLIIGLVDSRNRLRAFIWIYLLLIGWTAGSSLWGYASGASVGYATGIERARALTEAWGHPNSLAMTLVAGVPYLCILFPVERGRMTRIALASILGLCLITVIFTGSRAGMLGIVVTLFAIWWRTGRRLMPLVGLVAALLLVWIVMPAQYQTRLASIASFQTDPSSLGRIDSWKAGLAMFLDRPLLGVGPGNFGIAHGMAYSPGWRPSWLEAHSIYVQLPAELGLVGAAWFAFILSTVIANNAGNRRILSAAGRSWGWEYRLTMALDLSLLALLFMGLFGHNLYRPTYYFIAGTSVALAHIIAGTNSEDEGADEEPAGEPPQELAATSLAVTGRWEAT
jgi:probable O-glycosylation ligase (exosortase A-associated)